MLGTKQGKKDSWKMLTDEEGRSSKNRCRGEDRKRKEEEWEGNTQGKSRGRSSDERGAEEKEIQKYN